MKKLYKAIAVAALLVASCGPVTAPAFATPMPQCATGQGDTNEAVVKFLSDKWPMDSLYLFEGEAMQKVLAAATVIRNVTVAPPADTSEIWISSGPGGDGSTVFVLFAGDCYLGAFNMTGDEFLQTLKIAELEDTKPIKEPGDPASNRLIIPLAGARSA